MRSDDATCWTMVRDAAIGDAQARNPFAHQYGPVIRAYLATRWRDSGLRDELDDAVQDVFVECFRESGALDRVESGHRGGFRAFLFGVVRNVALRFEERRARRDARAAPSVELDAFEVDEATLSSAFDRAWAEAVLREAAARQRAAAKESGAAALRRVELLELRFHEGLPLRDIAKRWSVDPDWVHREYARARQDFREALVDVMSFYHPESHAAAQRACEELFQD